MPITPLLAAIFALGYIYLSIAVIKLRTSEKITDGLENSDSIKSRALEKAVRTHANFIEYVPMALILFWFLENITYSHTTVFWLGCILLIARVAHVVGMQNPREHMIFRVVGTAATFVVITFSAIKLIWWYLPVSI